ncbi:hypothetical protein BaRGS_00038558 [Batillaria attramentaria]|uniref:Uncharacterized protein n=1 Tax=Batillaria attramentaria TaxID=370345 RepID=A0ABD0J6D4_9CAEN
MKLSRTLSVIVVVFAIVTACHGLSPDLLAQGERCSHPDKAVFQHAWHDTPSPPGCDKNCLPVVSDVFCLAGTGGAGCWQAVSAKDILHIYDRCKDNITGVSFQCDGIPGKIDAGVKCLEGFLMDPCKKVEYIDVFNISLVREGKSLENRAVCHCQLQSRDWQNLSITVVNLYSGTGVNRTPKLLIANQEAVFSVSIGTTPETTVSSEYNLNISFDPQDQAKEARQIVEIQGKTIWIIVGAVGIGGVVIGASVSIAIVVCIRIKRGRNYERPLPKRQIEITTYTGLVPESLRERNLATVRNPDTASHIYSEVDEHRMRNMQVDGPSQPNLQQVSSQNQSEISRHQASGPMDDIETDDDGYLRPFARSQV